MSDLHTLIAAVVDEHADWGHRCHCGHQGGYPDHLADRIITALGLRRQDIPSRPGQPPEAHRHVTEWILND